MMERESDPDDPESIRDPPVPSVGNGSEAQNVAAAVPQPHRPVRYFIDNVGQGEDTDANRTMSASLGAAGVTAPPSSAAWTPPGAPPAPPIHAAPGAIHRQGGVAVSFPSASPVFGTAGPSRNCMNAEPATSVAGNRPAVPSNAAAWSPPAPPVHGTSGPQTVCCGCPSAAANASTPCHGLPSAERFPASAAGSPFLGYPGPSSQQYTIGGPTIFGSPPRCQPSALPGNIDIDSLLPDMLRGRMTRFQDAVWESVKESLTRLIILLQQEQTYFCTCSNHQQQHLLAHHHNAIPSFRAQPYQQGPITSIGPQYVQAGHQQNSSLNPSLDNQSHPQGPPLSHATNTRDFHPQEPARSNGNQIAESYTEGPAQSNDTQVRESHSLRAAVSFNNAEVLTAMNSISVEGNGFVACIVCRQVVPTYILKCGHDVCKPCRDELVLSRQVCPEPFCRKPFLLRELVLRHVS